MDNNDQKCFCHFQGFQVKDAVSRAALKNINDGVENKAPGSGAVATGTKKTISGAPENPPESAWRYNEAHGTGSMASGMGAVAYSRASKSLGYRTQAGHPTSPELAAARPEAVTKKDEAGNTVYPAENVEQAAVAIGADTAAVGKQSLAGGYKSVARGNMSVAIGNMLTADGVDSQAFGSENEVTKKADAAAVFGFRNKVTSAYSFVAGNLCGTDPEKPTHCSAVFGKFNTAVAPGQFICGEFSAPTEDMAFVVGNGVRAGTEDIEDNITRSNGFVVYKDGKIKAKNIPIEDNENPGCYYWLIDGEKEWENPPMIPGTEYRTTEKYNGKPVYRLLQEVALDEPDRAGADSPNGFTVDIPSGATVIEVNGVVKIPVAYTWEYPLPCVDNDGSMWAWASVDGAYHFMEPELFPNDNVTIWTKKTRDTAGYVAKCFIKYTKQDTE